MSILSAFWMLLEIWAYQYFWKCFFSVKVTKRVYFISIMALWMVSFSTTLFALPQYIYTFFFIVFYSVVFSVLFEGKWLHHLLVAILCFAAMSIIDTLTIYGTSILLGITAYELVWRKVLYTVINTSSRFLAVFLGWFFSRLRKSRGIHSVQGRWILLSTMFPALSFIMLLIIFEMGKSDADLNPSVLAFCGILFIVNIATIYLLNQMEQVSRETKEIALMNQQQELQTEHILALEKSYKGQRKAIHDFKNQIQTISDLLTMEEYEKAKHYVQELQETQTTRIFLANSGNTVIDAVLNHKSQLAAEEGIDMSLSLNDLSGINIGMDRMIVLLSNLLDNAIEACYRKESDRQIFCEIIANDTLWISVKNTSNPVKITNGTIPTSKEPKEDHGYGLPRIQSILDQLGAEYAFDYKDGWFTFVAEIPL